MTQIYWSYRPRKHIGGTSALVIDDSELDATGKQLLGGVNDHISELFSRVFHWFDLPAGDFAAIDALNEKTYERSLSGWPIASIDNEATGELLHTLGDFLALALLLEMNAVHALCASDITSFVSKHAASVRLFSEFNVFLNMLEATGEEGPGVLSALQKKALQEHLNKASQAAAKPHRAIKNQALEIYRSGNFQSKNQAAEKIAPRIGRTSQTVRGWLRGV